MFSKLKSAIFGNASRAMNKTTMIATCHGLCRVIYADGVVDDAELGAAMRIARNNPKLSAFGGEFNREMDKVLAAFKDSPRMGRVAANRALQDFSVSASEEEKEDLLIACLDMVEADGKVDQEELDVAAEIAAILGLDMKKFQ